MILTLQVVGEHAQGLGSDSRKVFNAIGGTIGRLADNDWVFLDPYVSGRHALIRYVNGKYFIEDTSTNGIYVNSPEARLKRSQPHQLRHGDRLYIDAYEIEVAIEDDPAASSRKDPFANPHTTPKEPAKPSRVQSEEDHTANLVLGQDEELEELEELEAFEDEGAANATQWYGGVEQPPAKHRPPVGGSSQAEPSVSPAARPEVRQAPPAQPPKSSARQSAPRPSGASAGAPLEDLLEAAGIEGLDPTSETAQVLGELLRISVSGVMDVLRTRERMKDELRMRSTTFKAVNNNPLKFSANVDDAFHNLLVKRNAAYLPPVEAFEDAFCDVRDHQAAFLVAMRLAFESMLAHFDPGQLQEDFDRQLKKGSILGVPAKLRYWDLYREKYGDMVKDADSSFRNLFGEQFARAYEEQLARMKSLNPGREK